MQRVSVLAFLLLWCGVAFSVEFVFEEQPGSCLLKGDGKTWMATMMAAFDPAKRDETYKVYTHIHDFQGIAPITKGPGGKYPHHRGMFIGWKDVVANGLHFNLWEMANTSQRHVAWLERKGGLDSARQSERIHWCDPEGKVLIEETRTLAVRPGPGGVRLFDFQSVLLAPSGDIQLRGDLQHAGMQVRMAQEVADHEDSTKYILPEGAQELPDDKVVGAWWVCCSPVVRDVRYWVVHMTPSGHPLGQPVYSIRRYARFGAFFEPDLQAGKPSAFSFRIAVSDKELDRAACESLYADYCKPAP
ncbi:MAG TPA: PmoA family protein [Candidatus Hydrogenedentes bacterium]|nr:PmoA family protein [Candidatus Hydrogenedentota bacterium]